MPAAAAAASAAAAVVLLRKNHQAFGSEVIVVGLERLSGEGRHGKRKQPARYDKPGEGCVYSFILVSFR